MFRPDVVEKFKEHTADWYALSDEQKVESLIARVRIWVEADGFSVAEVELAMNLALNAMTIIRASGTEAA